MENYSCSYQGTWGQHRRGQSVGAFWRLSGTKCLPRTPGGACRSPGSRNSNSHLNPIRVNEQPGVDDLRSYAYALLLVSTVQHHRGSLCEVIDPASFLEHLIRFYTDPRTVANEQRL